jgi:acetyltransferase-like isoleucine patch superfamily enzyme
MYGSRLDISSTYRVWGSIRFLVWGSGSIKIGSHFHAVSTRKRSFMTLFTPCHLTIVNDATIELGHHVSLNGVTLVSRKSIYIGNNTMIGPNTMVIDHDGHVLWPPSERWLTMGVAEDIVIEDDVWIGMNCIILKGVRIGCGSVVAAGSVVSSDVDSACLYGGNPARKIKVLGDSKFPA